MARGSIATETVVGFLSSATPGTLPGLSLAIAWLSVISTGPCSLPSLA